MNALPPKFTCIPLGVEGGLNESNLPAYLLAPYGSTEFVCLDAGTLFAGLKVANQKGCFGHIPIPDNSKLSVEGHILHHHIKAYLITHPYLDHLAGMVMASPNDSQKPIMGLEETIKDIEDHIFNWRTWPNFSNVGVPPGLDKHCYVSLPVGVRTPVNGTSMNVEAFPLAHGDHIDSTAFLIESEGFYALYMGDTGPDDVEGRTTTQDLWQHIASLVKAKLLRGIFIEASYTDEWPDENLCSHLTPAWIMRAFRQLAALVDAQNPQSALQDLTIIITHIKPDLSSGVQPREIVKKQLNMHNDLGLRFIFAEQGGSFDL